MRDMLLSHRRLRGPGPRLARGAVLLAGLLAAGCGGRLARQFEWVGANPGAPEAVRKAVLGKKLLEGVGMTEDAVVASWGSPTQGSASEGETRAGHTGNDRSGATGSGS